MKAFLLTAALTIAGLASAGPAFAQAGESPVEIEQTIRESLADILADGEPTADDKAAIRKLVAAEFDAKQKTSEARLAKLKEQLEVLEDRAEARRENRERMIDRQLAKLLNDDRSPSPPDERSGRAPRDRVVERFYLGPDSFVELSSEQTKLTPEQRPRVREYIKREATDRLDQLTEKYLAKESTDDDLFEAVLPNDPSLVEFLANSFAATIETRPRLQKSLADDFRRIGRELADDEPSILPEGEPKRLAEKSAAASKKLFARIEDELTGDKKLEATERNEAVAKMRSEIRDLERERTDLLKDTDFRFRVATERHRGDRSPEARRKFLQAAVNHAVVRNAGKPLTRIDRLLQSAIRGNPAAGFGGYGGESGYDPYSGGAGGPGGGYGDGAGFGGGADGGYYGYGSPIGPPITGPGKSSGTFGLKKFGSGGASSGSGSGGSEPDTRPDNNP